MVLVLGSAAIIIMKRDISSLVKTYAAQSVLLAIMAISLFLETRSVTLLFLASILIISKAIIIPNFIGHIQRKLNIKRDVEFHFLSPITSLFVSVFIVLFVYVSFSRLLAELDFFGSSLFFIGATVGMSLVFMGMIVIFTRKQTITNIIGYLTMENGVVLFSLFLAELPLLVEILIAIDLIILTLLSTILALGIDSTIEEFHRRLHPFYREKKQLSSEPEDENRQADEAALMKEIHEVDEE
jgi:hydrogenase-4 component E